MFTEQNHPDFFEGFGESSPADVQALVKALQANDGITDIANLTGGGALQPQSLESTLTLLTFKEQSLALWRDIPKGNAVSTLEEYSVQDGYGQEGGWVDQMETPEDDDADLARKYAMVKFCRSLWKVSDVAGIVKTITPAEVVQKRAATMRLLRSTNSSLYTGDPACIPQQIDGVYAAIKGNGSTDHVIDMRGVAPGQITFRMAAQLLADNFGNVSNSSLYVSSGGMTTLDQILDNVGANAAQRLIQGQVGADGAASAGYSIRGIHTSFGTITPKVDIHLGAEFEGRRVPTIRSGGSIIEGATSTKAPGTPSIVVTTQAGPVAGSKWSSTGVRPAGATYQYRVVARNRYGMSTACVAGDAAADVVAGGTNTIVITPAGTGQAATCFEIYSQQVESGEFRFMGRVANAGATTTVVDKNEDIPGTTTMFLLDMSSTGEDRAMQLARLAPLHSKEYARIGEYRWGSVNLYIAPKYYAPKKFIAIKNVPVDIDSTSQLIHL